MTTISKNQLENILSRIFQGNDGEQRRSQSIEPTLNIQMLDMSNYSFWSKAMKAALKLQGLWLEPTRNIATLTASEREINERAANYVLTNIDVNNMNKITANIESCFISIWNVLKQFHEPSPALKLVEFYSNIRYVVHQPGQCVRTHLALLKAQFEKVIIAKETLPESHKIAIILASVKDSPEFAPLFQSADWLERENLPLKTVKDSIIAAQDFFRKSKQNKKPIQTGLQSKVKNHNRRPANPRTGWSCPTCEMDNHKAADCWKNKKKVVKNPFVARQGQHPAAKGIKTAQTFQGVPQAFHGGNQTFKGPHPAKRSRFSTMEQMGEPHSSYGAFCPPEPPFEAVRPPEPLLPYGVKCAPAPPSMAKPENHFEDMEESD
jgi:hypothetical protein